MVRARMMAAVVGVTAALLIGGTGTAAASDGAGSTKTLRCYDLLGDANRAVGDMNTAIADMAEAAARGDGKAYHAASNDYDDALDDYGRAANRYKQLDCYWVIGHRLPLAPSKSSG
ncbi:MAG: hypothetical protein ACT4RN_03930 [Pseudonocardia sp.]